VAAVYGVLLLFFFSPLPLCLPVGELAGRKQRPSLSPFLLAFLFLFVDQMPERPTFSPFFMQPESPSLFPSFFPASLGADPFLFFLLPAARREEEEFFPFPESRPARPAFSFSSFFFGW